jgi:hypothetical protein
MSSEFADLALMSSEFADLAPMSSEFADLAPEVSWVRGGPGRVGDRPLSLS